VQVVAQLVVTDQPGECFRLGQKGVHRHDGIVLVHQPERAQPRAQRSDRLQLGVVVRAPAGPAPLPHEVVQLLARHEAVDVEVPGDRAGHGVDETGGALEGYVAVMGENHVDS